MFDFVKCEEARLRWKVIEGSIMKCSRLCRMHKVVVVFDRSFKCRMLNSSRRFWSTLVVIDDIWLPQVRLLLNVSPINLVEVADFSSVPSIESEKL